MMATCLFSFPKKINLLLYSKRQPQDESDNRTPRKKQQPIGSAKPSQRTPAAATTANHSSKQPNGYAAKPVLQGTPAAAARDTDEPPSQSVSPMLSPNSKQPVLSMPHQAVDDVEDVEKIYKLGRKLGDGNFAVVKVSE
jgi:hypothetical protein